MYRMLTVLVISGVEITPWSTLLKEIWRVGCRGADKYLARPRKKQAAPVKAVMRRGMN